MTLTSLEIHALLDNMADKIRQQYLTTKPVLIGIHTGGVWVAEAILARLGQDFIDGELSTLNIAYYRDDFTRIGIHPRITPSHLPYSIEDKPILLIDDVIHSGRTIRAALNEIFDYGRPASICLAVLFERGGRELPIQPDIIGQKLTLSETQHVKLSHDNLSFRIEIQSVGANA